MKKAGVLLAVVSLVCVVLGWWLSPSQVVKRKGKDLVALMNFQGASGVSVAEQYTLDRLLADEVLVEIPVFHKERLVFRDEATSAYAFVRKTAKDSEFEIVGMEPVVVNGGLAEVCFLLEGRVDLAGTRKLAGTHRVVFGWRKADRKWRLCRLRWEEKSS